MVCRSTSYCISEIGIFQYSPSLRTMRDAFLEAFLVEVGSQRLEVFVPRSATSLDLLRATFSIEDAVT